MKSHLIYYRALYLYSCNKSCLRDPNSHYNMLVISHVFKMCTKLSINFSFITNNSTAYSGKNQNTDDI